jgi:hypothetical protein
MIRQSNQNEGSASDLREFSPADPTDLALMPVATPPDMAAAAGLDAFAGLSQAALNAAAPLAASSPDIPPLDLAALGEFISGQQGTAGTLVVQSPGVFGGNVAFVDATQTAPGAYVVSAGTYGGETGPNGGATAALNSSVGSNQVSFNFYPDTANSGNYVGNLSNVSSTVAFNRLGFGDVKVLGWNSDSILLSTTHAVRVGLPASDIVISTTNMLDQPHSLPTDTTFTTTGAAPTILGVTVPEIPCFAAGTLIATPDGPRMVETLAAGDEVLTINGSVQRISWVGSRVVNCRAHPCPEKILPVRIRRHAFGADLPGRDLILSPDHAVFLDGVLIPICELVNGQNVVQEHVHTVRYVHVELKLHDILLAEGLPCESFLDIGNHSQFGEGPDAVGLHPDFAATALAWEAACAPLCLHGPEIDAARALLAEQFALAA